MIVVVYGQILAPMSAAEPADRICWTRLGLRLRSCWWAFVAVPLVLTLFDLAWGGGAAPGLPPLGQRSLLFTLGALLTGGSIVLTEFFTSELVRIHAHGRWPRLTMVASTCVGLWLGRALTLGAYGYWLDAAAMDMARASSLVIGVLATLIVFVIGSSLHALKRGVELRDRALIELENARLRAELDALQARTNPHFLFNALSLVQSLIDDAPEKASAAVDRLSDLLRYSMRSQDRAQVSLREELIALRDYLELQEMRFGARLHWVLPKFDDIAQVQIPPLSLQPLVENAVCHGLSGSSSTVHVEVRAELVDGWLYCRVLDDGPGDSTHSGQSSAHANLKARLAGHYGGQAQFSAGPRPEGGYAVELVLPPGQGTPRPVMEVQSACT